MTRFARTSAPKLALVLLLVFATTGGLARAADQPTQTTTLSIKGMTCGGCTASVKLQLKRTDGVKSYEVAWEKGEARVVFDPAKTTPEKIAEAVSKTGFSASVKKTASDETS